MYEFRFLYKNKLEESILAKMDKEEAEKMYSVVANSFNHGANGYTSLPDGKGQTHLVNLKEVVRLTVKKVEE